MHPCGIPPGRDGCPDREMPLDEIHPNIAPVGFDAGGTLFFKKT
jgi:hypothetical protein